MGDALRLVRETRDLQHDPELDLDAINSELEHQSAEVILAWASRTFGSSLVMSSSFGAESALMLHLVTQVVPNIPVVFLDTGYLFPETYQFAEELRARFHLDLRVYSPNVTAARLEALHGRLWEGTPEELERYAKITKIEPMDRALNELGARAWIAGLRRDQTSHRAKLRPVERVDGIYKVHPILRWTASDIERYIDAHELPYHPLYPFGYRSIGDVHSTTPTALGDDARKGRNLGPARECGIHLPRTDEEDASLKSSGL